MLSRLYHSLTFAVTILLTALIAVSCTPASLQSEDPDTVSLYFGHLEAKAVDTTAYDVSGSTGTFSADVSVGSAGDYWWSYTAEKLDGLFTAGATTAQTPCNGDNKGLGSAKTFSKGKWKFTLYAYASKADQTAGKQWLFSGTNETDSKYATGYTTSSTVSIPVAYSYIAGQGTAKFSVGVTLTQDSSFTTQYTVTGVTAVLGGTDVPLTYNSSTSKWEATQTSVASGVKTVGLKVFVDNGQITQASKDDVGKKAIVLHGMTTNISGTAAVTLTASTMSLSFSSTLPSEQPTEDGFPQPYKAPSTTTVGDTLTMGTYPSGNGNTSLVGQGITWKVLAVDTTNKRALVISENILEKRIFDADSNAYSGSDIQTYLRSDEFYTTYGLNKNDILNVDVTSDIETTTVTTTGEDKAFLLSQTEVETYYFVNNTAPVANYNGTASGWWLRSLYGNPGYAFYIHSSGQINSDSYKSTYGVRPAFWINMESGGGN